MVRRLTNDEGFATTFFLTLMPAIFAIGVLFTAGLYVVHIDHRLLNECRISLYNAQVTVAQHTNRLLDLNSRVEKLKKHRQYAKTARKLAHLIPFPPLRAAAIAAARVYYYSIRSLQKITRLMQKYQMLAARYHTTLRPLWASVQIFLLISHSRLPDAKERYLAYAKPATLSIWNVVPKTPPNDPYPEFETVEGFAETQAMQVNWRVSLINRLLGNYLPQWMVNFFYQPSDVMRRSLWIKNSCGAELVEVETEKWEATLSIPQAVASSKPWWSSWWSQ